MMNSVTQQMANLLVKKKTKAQELKEILNVNSDSPKEDIISSHSSHNSSSMEKKPKRNAKRNTNSKSVRKKHSPSSTSGDESCKSLIDLQDYWSQV